jgi:hypothetical protein
LGKEFEEAHTQIIERCLEGKREMGQEDVIMILPYFDRLINDSEQRYGKAEEARA